MASFYPMQFLAEQIGGDHVTVTALTKPGVEPHDLELSAAADRRSSSEADVILYLKGLQPAVDEAVAQSERRRTSVDAATLTTLEDHGTEVGHGHEGEEARPRRARAARTAGADPHIWLDPVKYAEVAKGVGTALEKADPDHAADYKKNTDALVEQAGRARTPTFEDGLKNTATKTFITTHAAFGYLAERYGLDQEAIAGLDPESEPSPARIKELQTIAKKDEGHHGLLRDAGQRQDREDPRRATPA